MVWSAEVAGLATKAKVPRCPGRPEPNDLWCADYKGEFMLADRRYCYPLTITDFASRYLHLLRCPGDHQGALRLYRV